MVLWPLSHAENSIVSLVPAQQLAIMRENGIQKKYPAIQVKILKYCFISNSLQSESSKFYINQIKLCS